MPDFVNSDCPFTYREGEEPPSIEHEVTGVCAGCQAESFTVDSEGTKVCWACAYDRANWA